MPGGGFIHAEGFEQVDGCPRKQEVGGTARLVVVTAWAVGLRQVKTGIEPVGGRIRVTQRVGVAVEQRLVPREAVVAEGEQSRQ
jgi:hypothetical protein